MKNEASDAEKQEVLKAILKEMGSVLVAYSGGTDSAFLLKTTADVLGDRVLAVIARSETYPNGEYERAWSLAQAMKIRTMTIFTEELKDPRFAANTPERCYFCKGELFSKLQVIAAANGLHVVADGTNADDVSDFRPGRKAAQEHFVRSPLMEAGLTKTDIRHLSRLAGLPTWNKPAQACLASRFPYGSLIRQSSLKKINAAEDELRRMGFEQVRVRHHGHTARIEVARADLPKLASDAVREPLVSFIKGLGYTYVTMDLEGYRTGSMNESLAA